MKKININKEGLQNTIINDFPYFISVNYERLLNESNWREKTRQCIHIFDFSIRAISLIILGQYLIEDRENLSNPIYNKLLKDKLPKATLGTWVNICFRGIQTYAESNHGFFLKELTDLYLDNRTGKHNKSLEKYCQRLVEIRNELSHGLPPQDENEWQTLFEEAHGLLLNVLEGFIFIAKYDLILVTQSTSNQLMYQKYRGTSITNEKASNDPPELKDGWFYFFRRSDIRKGDFLRLYPFFFGWSQKLNIEAEIYPKDAALLDKFTSARIYYLATVAWQRFLVDDEALLADFYYNYEKALNIKRINIDRIGWRELKQIAEQISEGNMSNARSKFNSNVYYQRAELQEVFEKFLSSDKTAFILLGKSGVGKTNFLISQFDNLEKDSDIIVFYSGSKLDTNIPLVELITNDFLGNLQSNEFNQGFEKNIFDILSKTQIMSTKKLIFVIDAINENKSPRLLLEQIDALITKNAHSWLKIVFSSRPEAWQIIKRGVKLAESNYFHKIQPDELDTSSFMYSSEIKPFTHNELPIVYEKYRLAYQLQTPFDRLPYKIRDLISDPLLLRLLSRIHAKKPILQDLKVDDITKIYIDYLIAEDVLRIADLHFLENELVTRMITSSNFSNLIHSEIIQYAFTDENQSLFDLIYNEDILANKQKVNQSFVNLVDAEILSLYGSALDYELGFKFERFYDYFAGRRLLKLSEAIADYQTFYLGLIRKTISKPFLWGAVKFALLHEFMNDSNKLISLCFIDEQRVKEMMVEVLTEFGESNSNEIKHVLNNLVPHLLTTSNNKNSFPLFGSRINKNAWKIAVEISSKLGIDWVLLETIYHSDASMRSMAIRFTYYLWQQNQILGFEILSNLSKRITSKLLPPLRAIESMVGLSLIIFFDHPNDEYIISQLQSQWKRIFQRFFSIKKRDEKIESLTRIFLREIIFSSALATIFGILREFPNYSILSNYKYIEDSAHLTSDEKQLYLRLLDYVEIDNPADFTDMEIDFEILLGKKNLFLQSAAVLAMNANLSKHPEEFLDVLKRFFDKSLAYPKPNPYPTIVPNALGIILDHNPEHSECFNFFITTMQKSQEYYLEPSKRSGMATNEYPPTLYIGPYLIYQYQREGTVHTQWFINIVTLAIKNNDILFFDALTKTQLNYVGIERRYPNIALNALAVFFKTTKNSEINNLVFNFLSRLRIYYPELVDGFLDEQEATSEDILSVKIHEPKQSIGDLIGIRVWFFLRDDVIQNHKVLRSIILRILSHLSNSNNFKEWADYFIREMVNLIYGEEILKPKKYIISS
ncbi:MAG: hypothetical protein J0M11_07945 [Anaerolineae bacterium]|nr:hypothetical protein [Anaerolineae bacterium]